MNRFHLSLNVSDIPKTVAYLEKLLGTPVAKQRPDYAKFELDSPPLVLSLEPRSPAQYGSLNHLGFRFPDSASLVEAQRRLEQAGLETHREEGVECCYARQTKFWMHDADHRLWEFYTLDDDHLDHRGTGQSLEQMVGQEAAAEIGALKVPVNWEHVMFQPFEPPGSDYDEIRLRGTFNVPVSDEQMRSQLERTFSVLKPGGKVVAHILTAEEPVSGELKLPGMAQYVKYVPVRTSLLEAMEQAGFVDLQFTTLRSGACFEHEGHPLRETQIVGRRPLESCGKTCAAVYKGPFLSVTDDEGNVWRRGEVTEIPLSRWETIEQSPMAEYFVLFPHVAQVSHCGT